MSEEAVALTAQVVPDDAHVWAVVSAYGNVDAPLFGALFTSEEQARNTRPEQAVAVGDSVYCAVVRITVPRHILRERRGTYVPRVKA